MGFELRFGSGGRCMLRKIALCFVLFVLFSWFVHACFAVGQADANQMLAEAENALVSAYVSVAEANSVGANVSQLLVKLEDAGALLAEAQNSYRVGDYERAYLLALNCSNTVDNVVQEALTLKSETEEAQGQKLLFTAGVSSACLSVLFVLSLFGWRFLKKAYLKRVLEMKPEVGSEPK